MGSAIKKHSEFSKSNEMLTKNPQKVANISSTPLAESKSILVYYKFTWTDLSLLRPCPVYTIIFTSNKHAVTCESPNVFFLLLILSSLYITTTGS
jgi:hypothetical protein